MRLNKSPSAAIVPELHELVVSLRPEFGEDITRAELQGVVATLAGQAAAAVHRKLSDVSEVVGFQLLVDGATSQKMKITCLIARWVDSSFNVQIMPVDFTSGEATDGQALAKQLQQSTSFLQPEDLARRCIGLMSDSGTEKTAMSIFRDKLASSPGAILGSCVAHHIDLAIGRLFDAKKPKAPAGSDDASPAVKAAIAARAALVREWVDDEVHLKPFHDLVAPAGPLRKVLHFTGPRCSS